MTSPSKDRAKRVWVTSVHVSDLDRALRFYRDLLGFPIRLEARRFGWIEVGPSEPLGKIGLLLRPKEQISQQNAKSTGIILEVEDMDAFVRRLRSAGVRITREPVQAPWGGIVADFADPDGNELEAVYDPDHYAPGRNAP
jgi:lactoylglutathione lyase